MTSSSPADVQSLVLPDLNNTIGAVFIGMVFACIFFGITSLQTYIYYHHYPNDSTQHKLVVGLLWCLDTLHLAAVVHAVYTYLVTGFGDFGGFNHVLWSIKLQVLVNVLVILLVQSMYAMRVWKLGGYHHGTLGYVVAGAVLGGFGVGILLSVEVYKLKTFSDLNSISWVSDTSLGASTVIDFVLSCAMCYYLLKSKGKESVLNSRISRMMQYCLSSGLFTSAFSLVTLFTESLMPNTLIFLGFQFLLEKLYVVSFLAMLNARQRPKATPLTTIESFGTSPSIVLKRPSPSSTGGSGKMGYLNSPTTPRLSDESETLYNAPISPIRTPLTAYQFPSRNESLPHSETKPTYMRNW